MLDADWTDANVLKVLGDRYRLDAYHVFPLRCSDSTAVAWHVECADASTVLVTQYLARDELPAARRALGMSEFCRAAELSVPRVRPDRDGDLLCTLPDEGTLHGTCSVVDADHGAGGLRPYTRDQAEHMGLALGRMHQVLAGYPLPSQEPVGAERAWAVLCAADAVAAHEAASVQIVARGAAARHVALALQQIRRYLSTHLAELRGAVPAPKDLTAHAIHGQFMPPYVQAATGLPVVSGFLARTGYVAWEVARAAFNPRTVAQGQDWQVRALALLYSYHKAHEHFPVAELAACPRLAALDMLCTPVSSAAPAEWERHVVALRRLLDALPELDEALRHLFSAPRRTV
ncbi:hypothetical protein [Streptomyces sp. NPDC087300]|uniref:hypothetical protein n=1 Tax=Streptomyces sp. NPDC087300 TaxID=3365780 RepID=UPI00381A95B6